MDMPGRSVQDPPRVAGHGGRHPPAREEKSCPGSHRKSLKCRSAWKSTCTPAQSAS